MIIDIVPYNSHYRGMGRNITVEHFNSKKAKKNFYQLCEQYLLYVDLFYFEKDESVLWEEILSFYRILIENDIDCEIIAYDNKIISDIHGYKVEFLGIDIVKEMCESLIYYSGDNIDKNCLNKNGLCENVKDTRKIINTFNEEENDWKPCWIYKIII